MKSAIREVRLMGANRNSACATTVRILQCAELTAGRSADLDNYVNSCVVESSGRSWALCVAFTWMSCDIWLEDAYIEEACWKDLFGKATALHFCTVRLDGHDALLQHGDEIMGPLSRAHSYYWRVGEGERGATVADNCKLRCVPWLSSSVRRTPRKVNGHEVNISSMA